jgi:butyryl-CoA dehydrogenase
MKEFRDRVAAITGAASGIGAALGVELARRGAHVALSDVDAEGLAVTAAACEGLGVKVTTRIVDVADRAAVADWATEVVDQHGRVNLVVNNAGVALSATIESMSYEDLDWLMAIDFWGVVHGTKEFLPHLKAAGEGHVVNISSVFGLMAIPTQSAYNAAKFGVRGFTDALRIELDIERCGVSATTVHPGGIRTNIVRNARLDPLTSPLGGDREAAVSQFAKAARTTPESAARQILVAVQRNRRRALIGPDAVLFDAVSRLPAGVSQRVLAVGSRLRR